MDSQGFSWRSGAKVEQIKLEQWFFKITELAPRLLEDLKELESGNAWPSRVVAMQTNWLGRSEGAALRFTIKSTKDESEKSHEDEIRVFTTRPDTIFGVRYLALSLDHPVVQRQAAENRQLQAFIDEAQHLELDSKAGYQLPGIFAENPIRLVLKDEHPFSLAPVFAAPYVRSEYATGAVMGVPAHDARDFAFWKQNAPNDANIAPVIHKSRHETKRDGGDQDSHLECFTGPGYLSGACQQYAKLSSAEASTRIVDDLSTANPGSAERNIQWRLRDWLISRQRYWGTPIPIIHCDQCGKVPVPDQDLPVQLPKLDGVKWEERRGNPLEELAEWCQVSCPKCGKASQRETDTMDTFVDSSWYFLNFAQSANRNNNLRPYMPVDLYIGGVEHAILHLLYARFICKLLSGLSPGSQATNEPFAKLLTQGMVHGRTYSDPISGKFLKPEEVDFSDAHQPKVLTSGTIAAVSYEKMSKSKYNGVDPLRCIRVHGADVTRAHLLFQAPVSEVLEWDEEKIVGIQRWLGRVWSLTCDMAEDPHFRATDVASQTQVDVSKLDKNGADLWKAVQRTIDSVTQSLAQTYTLNTVVSDLMQLTNVVQQGFTSPSLRSTEVGRQTLSQAHAILLRLMTPLTPSFAEECWTIHSPEEGEEDGFIPGKTISATAFPEPDGSLSYSQSRSQACVVQVNGKLKFATEIATPPEHIPEEELKLWVLRRVLESPEGGAACRKSKWNIQEARKIIVARGGRVLNLVF